MKSKIKRLASWALPLAVVVGVMVGSVLLNRQAKAQLQSETYYGSSLSGLLIGQGLGVGTSNGTILPMKWVYTNGGNWTNQIPSGSAYTNVVKIPNTGKDLALEFSGKANQATAASAAALFYIGASVGGTMPTNGPLGAGSAGFALSSSIYVVGSVTVPLNGTTPVTGVTNIPAVYGAAIPYFYVLWATNSATNGDGMYLTNWTVRALSR